MLYENYLKIKVIVYNWTLFFCLLNGDKKLTIQSCDKKFRFELVTLLVINKQSICEAEHNFVFYFVSFKLCSYTLLNFMKTS
jgi:hypothetical protein